MNDIVWVAVAVAIGLLLWLLVRRRATGTTSVAPAAKRDDGIDTVTGWLPSATRVLSLPERRAYAMLTQVLPDHIVLAQVPLARFIRVPTRNSYQEWMRRVGQLCADFVVCDAASQVVAVVELRSPQGQEADRSRKRHDRMDRVLRKAGIRVLTWNEDALPVIDAVREQVLRATGNTNPGALDPLPPLSTGPTGAPAMGGLPPREPGLTARPGAVGPVTAQPRVPVAHVVTHEADADVAPTAAMTKLEAMLAQLDSQQPQDLPEPTPSTYFDDLDSGPTPLDPKRKPAP